MEILARSAADGPGPPGEGALKHEFEREGCYRDRASQHSSAQVERAFRLRSVQKSASCTEALTVPYVAAARVTVLGTPALLLHEFDVGAHRAGGVQLQEEALTALTYMPLLNSTVCETQLPILSEPMAPHSPTRSPSQTSCPVVRTTGGVDSSVWPSPSFSAIRYDAPYGVLIRAMQQ